MKFKITELDTLKMKVEYSDGSWALIPSEKGKDKAWYAQRIVDFCATPQEPVAIADHPMKVGDEGDVGDGVPEVEEPEVVYFTASECREYCYPTDNQQLEALYDARTGNNTLLTAVDAHIKFVKDSIALDSTKYTSEQMEAKLKELKADSKFVTHGL
tara:strand:- start:1361 stop:1831 length:471 start_codon:yes stop_codon:yes gene_type:complete